MRVIVVCALVFLFFGEMSGASVSSPDDSQVTARESLFEAFRAVRDADLSGVPRSDLAQLSTQLNQALDLLQQGNYNLSQEISAQTRSRATTLQDDARTKAFRASVFAYTSSFLAATLSAVIVMESHRIRHAARRLFPPQPKQRDESA